MKKIKYSTDDINFLQALLKEFDRLTEIGLLGRHTYSLREEFFNDLEKFKSKYDSHFNQERPLLENAKQLSFDNYIDEQKARERFDEVYTEAGTVDMSLNHLEPILKELCFQCYKQGLEDSL